MKTGFIYFIVLLLTACTGGNYYPTLSGDPERMSGQTLCFRHANTGDPDLATEITKRNIDCAGLLSEDPVYNPGGRELDTTHRSIGR